MINKKKLNHISIFVMAAVIIGCLLTCVKTDYAQSLEPDPLFLEIESYIEVIRIISNCLLSLKIRTRGQKTDQLLRMLCIRRIKSGLRSG